MIDPTTTPREALIQALAIAKAMTNMTAAGKAIDPHCAVMIEERLEHIVTYASRTRSGGTMATGALQSNGGVRPYDQPFPTSPPPARSP